MKFTFLLKSLVLCFVVLSLNSCAKNETINSLNLNESKKLEKSKKIWLKYKEENKNSYEYFVNFASWAGFGHETKITVRNGKFIKREYNSWNRESKNKWIESTSHTLGKHKEGAKLKFIDKFYNECENILESKSKKLNNIYFEVDKRGLLKYCLYSPINCADDCSNGVNIKELNFIK